VSKRDYYEVLGINRDATSEEIRKAYRKLARKYHAIIVVLIHLILDLIYLICSLVDQDARIQMPQGKVLI
jgi:hypothetical protein